MNYITAISHISDKSGNYLLDMLDFYGKTRLLDITAKEAEDYYLSLIERIKQEKKI